MLVVMELERMFRGVTFQDTSAVAVGSHEVWQRTSRLVEAFFLLDMILMVLRH
jgi:hypothetical protein